VSEHEHAREVGPHAVTRRLMETIAYPEHDPRKASAEYHHVHHHLVVELDEACWICGVRASTLGDPAHNVRGSKQMETHHVELEWALANAADPAKILAAFPAMAAADEEHLRQWLDSESNMLVLCDVCHRHPHYGVHSITHPAWVAQKWLRDGYDLVKGESPEGGQA
jgi:hypothetical protein